MSRSFLIFLPFKLNRGHSYITYYPPTYLSTSIANNLQYNYIWF